MITFKPTHKSYKPASKGLIGSQQQLLTCLNTSETVQAENAHIKGKRAKKLVTRFYSMKSTETNKLDGHAPRILLTDCFTKVQESTRLKVKSKGSKDPHAWLVGSVEGFIGHKDDSAHEKLINTMIKQGAVYIGYNPYITDDFVILGANVWPDNVANLATLKNFTKTNRFKDAYAFEHGILAII